MHKKYRLSIFLMIIFVVSPAISADPVKNSDTAVVKWTESILLKTLSLNYNDLDNEFSQSKPFYSPEAWQALNSFLGNNLSTIKDNQLMLHPQSITAGEITNSGQLFDTQYWTVQQSFSIPELALLLNCSIIVTKKAKNNFLIQSINMRLSKINNAL